MEKHFSQKVAGHKCWDLINDNKSQCIGCPLFSGISIGKTDTYEARSILGEKTFEISHTGMIFQGKKALLEIFQDITEQKLAEDALQRSEFVFKESQRAASIGTYDSNFITDTWESSEVLDQIYGIDKSYKRDLHGLLDIIHPDDREMVNNYLMDDVILDHKPFNLEFRIIRKNDTEIRWVVSSGEIKYGDESRGISMIGTIQDITERKHAEEQLRKSEEKYRSIFENVQDVYFETAIDGTVLEVSPSIENISDGQYNQKELIGRSMYDFYANNETRDSLLSIIKEYRSVLDFELPFRNKDGKFITCSISAKLMLDEHGLPSKIIGTLRNITERKLADKKLKNSEEQFRLLLNSTAEAIYGLDTAGKCIFCNKAAIRMLGYSNASEIIGGDMHELIHHSHNDGSQYQKHECKILETIHEGIESHVDDEVFWTIHGTSFPAEYWSYPISHEGKIIGSVITFFDITERKRAEVALQESLESLKKSQEISHVGSWNLMIETGHVVWSDEMYKIFGIAKKEPGENMHDAFTHAILHDDKAKVGKVMAATFLDDTALPLDFRIVRTDGSVRSVHLQAESQLNGTGRIIAQHGILQDLTEQKQNEKALRESEKMYRTLLNASPEGIVIMNMKGIITEISNITLEIFGAEKKSEFIGVHFFNFIPRPELSKLKEVLNKTQTEGLVQNVEFILNRKNHSQFICELSTTLIQETDGRPKSYMAIIRDISQRKKIEQQLIRTERLVSLGEMASAMAHEINQPLLSITLGIENLFNKIEQVNAVDETYFHNKSEKIFNDIARIGRIIDHVRAFSRDNDDYIYTSFDINNSIENAIAMISEQFKHYEISLILRLDENIPPLNGNTYRFEQVILNLLNNARDALESKTKLLKHDFERTINIRSWRDDQKIYVEIKDNGSGISPSVIDRIMLPFYTTKEVGKGTGLGLSVSFGIIKEMNGNIDVESDPPNGTLFRLTLPVARIKKSYA